MLTAAEKYSDYPEALLTAKEVAALLKISPRTVREHSRRFGGDKPFGIGVIRYGLSRKRTSDPSAKTKK